MRRTRTTIEIDDAKIKIVMDRYHLRTKTEAVDFALSQLAPRRMTVEEISAMHGANLIGEIPPDRGPRSLDDPAS